jgi:hypothetical protein
MTFRAVAIGGILVAVAASVSATPNPQAASTCAASLSPDSKTIYAAVAPKVTPTTDLPDVIRSTTRGLVMGGQLDRANAKPAAEAAGACLAQLKG